MRYAALEFAHDVADNFPIAEPVIELGAREATGQEGYADVRGIFGAAEHIGCDIQEGPGVDRVEDIHDLSFEDASVGTVLCFETLEHVVDPIRAVQEMHRVLRPDGILAISSVMFFPIHAHPWDFWRFTPEGFSKLLEIFPTRLVVAHGYELLPEGVYGVGIKGDDPDLGTHRLPRITHLADHWADALPVDFGPIRFRTRDLWRHTMRESVASARRRLNRRH